MKNVLTFMFGQIATLCVSIGLYMAVMNLATWGAPIMLGLVFSALAVLNEKIPSGDDPA